MVNTKKWKYRNSELIDDDISKSALGFVYKITQLSTGRQYIGKKQLFFTKTKQVKGKKKKVLVDSDWKNYWSSSPNLKELVATIGEQDFEREILVFCNSKSSLAYCEEMALYMLGVLEQEELYFNENIRSKVYRSWVRGKEEIQELRTILQST